MLRLSLTAIAVLTMGTVANARLVKVIPGLNTATGLLPSNMYSGYVTVDAAHDRRLFYMFVESYRDPKNDPVVLWLNGGPGCSSVAAYFEEHGPLLMDFDRPGTGVVLNPNTWANVANVIYLESPAGVGFSVSNVTADYTTGDDRTASDSFHFLQGFF